MQKTAKIILGIIVIAAVAYGIWYATTQKSNTSTESIKIGLSGALTGEVAAWGQNGLAGVVLAAKEINDKGGINGRKIEIIFEDDKALPEESAKTFNKLVNVDKVLAIIGASGSGATAAAIDIAQNQGTPVVVAFASAPNLTKGRNYIFRVTASDSFQGKYSADFLYNKLGKKKIAVLYTKNDWGQGIADVFEKEAKALGGEVVYANGVLPTSNDLKTEIIKIKNSGAEILYCPMYPDTALVLFKQVKEMNFNLPIVCGDSIDGSDVIESPYAEGIIYTLPKVEIAADFEKKINSLDGFKDLKVTLAAPLAYDASKVLFSAVEKAGNDRVKIREALTKISYQGVSNPVIEFDENNELKNAVFQARIIKNKVSLPYEK